MRIILDTSFILTALKFKVDIYSQLKRFYPNKGIYILDKTLQELKGKKFEKLALQLLKKNKVKIIKTKKGNVDNLLLTYKKDIIASQDKELKKRLKEKNIKIATIRQKRYIEISGGF